MEVTPSFFRVARVKAALGRTFTETKGEVGRNDKVDPELRPTGRSATPATGRSSGARCGSTAGPARSSASCPQSFEFLERDATPLDAARVHARAEVGRGAPQQQLDQHRAAARRRDDRPGAGPGEGDQRREPRPDSRQLKPLLVNAGFHTKVVPLKDDPGPQREEPALPAVGRHAVRPADRVRERRSTWRWCGLARPPARPRHAAVARRQPGRDRRQVCDREPPADDRPAAWSACWSAGDACALLTGLDLEQIPRGAEIRLDAVPRRLHRGPVGAARPRRRRRSRWRRVFSVNLSSVFHEGGRTGTGGRGPRLLPARPRRDPGGGGVRAADRHRPAARQLPAGPGDRSRGSTRGRC